MNTSIELERSLSDVDKQTLEQTGQTLSKAAFSVHPESLTAITESDTDASAINREDDHVFGADPISINSSNHFDDENTSATVCPSNFSGDRVFRDHAADADSLDNPQDDKLSAASSPTLSVPGLCDREDPTNDDESIDTDCDDHATASGAIVGPVTTVEEYVDDSKIIDEAANRPTAKLRHRSLSEILLSDNNESKPQLYNNSNDDDSVNPWSSDGAKQNLQRNSAISDRDTPGPSVLNANDDFSSTKLGVKQAPTLSENDWPMNDDLRKLRTRQEFDLSNDDGPDFGPSPTIPTFPGAWSVVDADIDEHNLARYDWRRDPLLLRTFKQNQTPWRNLSTLIQFLRDGLMWLLLVLSRLVSSFGGILHLHAVRLHNDLRWQRPILDGVLLFLLAYGLAQIGTYYQALDHHNRVLEMHSSLNFTLSSAADGLSHRYGIGDPTIWAAQLDEVIHITDSQISNIQELKMNEEVKDRLVSKLEILRHIQDMTHICLEDLSEELQYTVPGNLVPLSNARQSLNGRRGWWDSSDTEVRQAFVRSLLEVINATDNEILRPISMVRQCKDNLDLVAEFEPDVSRTIQIARTQLRLEDSNKSLIDILLRPGASRASEIQQQLRVRSLNDLEIRVELDYVLEYLSKYEEDVRTNRPALYTLLAQSSTDELIGLDIHLLEFFARVAMPVRNT